MRGARRTVLGLMLILALALLPQMAAAQDAPPPDLDCGLGFNGLRAHAAALPGATAASDGLFDVYSAEAPETWRVSIAFTSPQHAAHPAATLRTFRKQVTGVWTAQSKGCGFGDQAAFASLMADMKARDSELTNASREDAERKKQEQPPLGGAP